MSDVLAGVKVLEVAAWTFVPAAGAVLADWGAEVIKVEHPESGDPQRGLISMGLVPGGTGGVNYIMEQPNRGKRSIGLDISTDRGREILYDLARGSDVFLTSFLPDVRERLRIDVEDIRAVNPDIIYVRGSGQGTRGPDGRRGGLDGSAYWARGGVADALTPLGVDHPVGGRAAFGDLAGGMTIAGGIAAALFKRATTGRASLVDVSLLGQAMWQLAPDIVASGLTGGGPMPKHGRGASPNPLVGMYRTQDGRFLSLMMLQSDRFWPEVCERLDRADLLDDPRFVDGASRFEHREACTAALTEIFASQPLAHWRERMAGMKGVWEPVQQTHELVDDPQVIANGYLRRIDKGPGFDLVANPVQIDETADELRGAPEHGEHTDEILQELGLDMEQILADKAAGAVL